MIGLVDDISKEFLEQFKKHISKYRGRVLILVHPFFSNHPEGAYFERLKQLLGKINIPVIVLEERANSKDTHDKIKRLLKNPDQLLVVQTFENDPAPLLKNSPKGIDLNLSVFAEFLNTLGVKKPLIAGMYANRYNSPHYYKFVHEYEQKNNLKYSQVISNGCVGITYRELIKHGLKNGLNPRLLPNLLYPDSPIGDRSKFKIQPYSKKLIPILKKLR